MNIRTTNRLSMAVTVIGLLVIMPVFVMIVSTTGFDASASTSYGVYLELPGTPDEFQLNIDSATRTDNGVTVVHSIDALVAEVQATHPQSIWFTRTAADSIPSAWIRELSQQGVVIVGIRMTRRELGETLGIRDIGGSPDWQPAGVPTFVIYYERFDVPFTNDQGEPATFGAKGWFNDAYNPESPERLFFFVDEAIRGTQRTVPDRRPEMLETQ